MRGLGDLAALDVPGGGGTSCRRGWLWWWWYLRDLGFGFTSHFALTVCTLRTRVSVSTRLRAVFWIAKALLSQRGVLKCWMDGLTSCRQLA